MRICNSTYHPQLNFTATYTNNLTLIGVCSTAILSRGVCRWCTRCAATASTSKIKSQWSAFKRKIMQTTRLNTSLYCQLIMYGVQCAIAGLHWVFGGCGHPNSNLLASGFSRRLINFSYIEAGVLHSFAGCRRLVACYWHSIQLSLCRYWR